MIFGLYDSFYHESAAWCWSKMLEMHFAHIQKINVAVFNEESVQTFTAKVQRAYPTFTVPQIKPTEKRNYAVKGVLIVLAALVVGLLIALPYYNLYY